jgi:hypothetical protein
MRSFTGMNLSYFYLLLALAIWVLGYFHTGKYVRPKWKIPGKLLFYLVLSGLLAHWVGHYALLFVIGHPLVGLLFHIKACKKHHINWKDCTPRDRYLALQEKWARGEW